MAESKWAAPIQAITPYVMLIETPTARGTGSIIKPPPGSQNACVVTAWHVIQHANEWHEPIKLVHFPSKKEVFLDSTLRNVSQATGRDQAIIEFNTDRIGLPSIDMALFPADKRLLEGVEIGWLGYPSVAPNALCFFHGHISAWLQTEEAYLVDGVAINGVSGGPAFVQSDDGKPMIVGLVTEYRPNIATGNLLPGVSLIRAINPLTRHYASIQKKLESARVQELPTEETAPNEEQP